MNADHLAEMPGERLEARIKHGKEIRKENINGKVRDKDEVVISVSHEEIAAEIRPLGRSSESLNIELAVRGKMKAKDKPLKNISNKLES